MTVGSRSPSTLVGLPGGQIGGGLIGPAQGVRRARGAGKPPPPGGGWFFFFFRGTVRVLLQVELPPPRRAGRTDCASALGAASAASGPPHKGWRRDYTAGFTHTNQAGMAVAPPELAG